MAVSYNLTIHKIAPHRDEKYRQSRRTTFVNFLNGFPREFWPEMCHTFDTRRGKNADFLKAQETRTAIFFLHLENFNTKLFVKFQQYHTWVVRQEFFTNQNLNNDANICAQMLNYESASRVC